MVLSSNKGTMYGTAVENMIAIIVNVWFTVILQESTENFHRPRDWIKWEYCRYHSADFQEWAVTSIYTTSHEILFLLTTFAGIRKSLGFQDTHLTVMMVILQVNEQSWKLWQWSSTSISTIHWSHNTDWFSSSSKAWVKISVTSTTQGYHFNKLVSYVGQLDHGN